MAAFGFSSTETLTDGSSYLQVEGRLVYETDDLRRLHKLNEKLNRELAKVKQQLELKCSWFYKEEDKLKMKNRRQLKQKENEFRELKQTIDQKVKEKEKMQKQLDEYRCELIAKDIALEENRKRIETLEERLQQLETELANVKKKKRIPSSDTNYQEQQKELKQTREQLEMLKAKVNELYEKLHDKDERIAGTVYEMNEKVGKLEGLVSDLKMDNIQVNKKLDEVLGLLQPPYKEAEVLGLLQSSSKEPQVLGVLQSSSKEPDVMGLLPPIAKEPQKSKQEDQTIRTSPIKMWKPIHR
ncbi:hypothetical protein DPMN_033051 [Dreissena polymorpha]|uniref:Uncharacterized protein n=1 Tax=Dreissena polymorpha TaxID=45954 RepID=A0A9D4RJH7_DREPO|nr:hypothetical protein DPMN_033051 [Dreissena polymorpha]